MLDNILIFIVIGFVAQIVDGSIGMAYGVVSTSLLLSFGVSPAAASASVHFSEVITTGISGVSHLSFRNVDKDLVKRLLIPGIVGGVIGAYILTSVPEAIIRPIVSVYLIMMGIFIILKVTRRTHFYDDYEEVRSHLVPLGLGGGFLDAVGGGGWGPIVTSTLIARGNHPRFAIGSVNLTEFFVAAAQSVVFILTVGLVHWQVTVGLLIGGGLAAPLAAVVTQRLPPRTLINFVGVVVIALSVRTIFLTFR